MLGCRVQPIYEYVQKPMKYTTYVLLAFLLEQPVHTCCGNARSISKLKELLPAGGKAAQFQLRQCYANPIRHFPLLYSKMLYCQPSSHRFVQQLPDTTPATMQQGLRNRRHVTFLSGCVQHIYAPNIDTRAQTARTTTCKQSESPEVTVGKEVASSAKAK